MLVVGDNIGVPRALRHLDSKLLCGVVAAEIRPQYLAELGDIAAAYGVPLLVQPLAASARYSEFIRHLRELAPDLIFCDSYSMRLRGEILAVPKAGAVNVHGGILPEYRGSNPVQWAIIRGETQAGVTIHYMDEGFDSGAVIACRRVALEFTDTWLQVMERIASATELLIAEQLPLILDGHVSAQPQDGTRARHHQRRRPEDGRIDWILPVRDIYNLIRALVSPLPGAFYMDAGEAHVLDRYLTVSEVATLKQRYGTLAGATSGSCRLRVEPDASNDPLSFFVIGVEGKATGRATLCNIDYESGRATALVDPESAGCDRAIVIDLLTQFARSELMISEGHLDTQ